MVSSYAATEIFRKLREDKENRNCFDCGDIDITHASINLGILLCRNCASLHQSLGIEISCIKALNEPWTANYLKRMTAGGNSSLKAFFSMYSIPCNSSNEYKYRTIACEYYREMLKMMAEGDRIMMMTPTEEEGSMLMEEFRPVENIVQKETREENDSNNRPKRNSAILSSYTESFYSFKDFTSGALSAVSP